jgi:hypothetical protein
LQLLCSNVYSLQLLCSNDNSLDWHRRALQLIFLIQFINRHFLKIQKSSKNSLLLLQLWNFRSLQYIL